MERDLGRAERERRSKVVDNVSMFPTCGKYRQNPAANQILPLETLFVP